MGTRRSEFHCDISAFTDFVLVQSVLRDTFIDICINVSLTLKFQFSFYATNGYCFEAQSIEVRPVDTRTTCITVTVNLFWYNIKTSMSYIRFLSSADPTKEKKEYYI